jgi:hypothetical protein
MDAEQRESDDLIGEAIVDDLIRITNAGIEREKESVVHIKADHPHIGPASWTIIQTAIRRLRENPWLQDMYLDQRNGTDLCWRQHYVSKGYNPGEWDLWRWNIAGRWRDYLGMGSQGVPN